MVYKGFQKSKIRLCGWGFVVVLSMFGPLWSNGISIELPYVDRTAIFDGHFKQWLLLIIDIT